MTTKKKPQRKRGGKQAKARAIRFLLDVDGEPREPVMYGDEVVVDDPDTGSQIRGVVSKPLD